MKCDLCSKQATCTKVLSFEKLPKYLIVSVNRFQYQNNTKVKILAQLQLDFQIEINQQKYDLYALIVHIVTIILGNFRVKMLTMDTTWPMRKGTVTSGTFWTIVMLNRRSIDLNTIYKRISCKNQIFYQILRSKQTPYIMFYRKQEKK